MLTSSVFLIAKQTIRKITDPCVCVCVRACVRACVCVFVRERERETERGRAAERISLMSVKLHLAMKKHTFHWAPRDL